MESILQKIPHLSKRPTSFLRVLRNFANVPPKKGDCDEECPKRASCEKEKKPFWKRILKTQNVVRPPKPPLKTCHEMREEEEKKPDPDLSEFGPGDAYKTCGSAFLIQTKGVMVGETPLSREDEMLKVIEANIGRKENALDPMPPFTTVGQRMLDLTERKLHPLYRVYQSIPKRSRLALPQRPTYIMRSGPINLEDIPAQFKFNRKILNKKNMFADYKRVQPPQQLMARIIELKRNEKPTIRKIQLAPDHEADPTKKQTVFETLYQKETKF